MSEPIRTPNYPLLSLERGVVQQDCAGNTLSISARPFVVSSPKTTRWSSGAVRRSINPRSSSFYSLRRLRRICGAVGARGGPLAPADARLENSYSI
jgi:hypothetical protein